MSKKLPKEVTKIWESKLKQSKKNKHISYSAISTFQNCPAQWYYLYAKKLVPFSSSMHTIFGNAVHETIQDWLEVLYFDSVKKANEVDLHRELFENMVTAFKAAKAQSVGHLDRNINSKQMQLFYQDGVHILDFIKKKRNAYFTTKDMQLCGVETLLYHELKPGVMFKGFIDLVFYNKKTGRYLVMDIKTSTRGWDAFQKKDISKTQQVALYRDFFSKQFDVPIEDIDVEFFIVKRRIPKDPQFPAAAKRVQQFSPAVGPRKTKQLRESFESSLVEMLDEDNNWRDHSKNTNPGSACKFCDVGRMKLCNDWKGSI